MFLKANACLRLSNSKSKAVNVSNNHHSNSSNNTQVVKNNGNIGKHIHINDMPSPAKELEVEQDDLEDEDDDDEDEDEEEEDEEEEAEEEVCLILQRNKFLENYYRLILVHPNQVYVKIVQLMKMMILKWNNKLH